MPTTINAPKNTMQKPLTNPPTNPSLLWSLLFILPAPLNIASNKAMKDSVLQQNGQ